MEVRSEEQLRVTEKFVEALEGIGYNCGSEVLVRIGKHVFYGFYSDGSLCGEVFEKAFGPLYDNNFGLLGEMEFQGVTLSASYLKKNGTYYSYKEASIAFDEAKELKKKVTKKKLPAKKPTKRKAKGS
jgi:hypothetical protein